jgi:hypothetical protein
MKIADSRLAKRKKAKEAISCIDAGSCKRIHQKRKATELKMQKQRSCNNIESKVAVEQAVNKLFRIKQTVK